MIHEVSTAIDSGGTRLRGKGGRKTQYNSRRRYIPILAYANGEDDAENVVRTSWYTPDTTETRMAENLRCGSTVAVISAPFQSVTGVVEKNHNSTDVRLHDVVGLRYEWKDATTRGHNHRWGKSFRPVYARYMIAATVSVPG